MKYLSKSIEETNKIAGIFLKKISAHTHTYTNTNHTVVVGLFGDLGSGKTTFTQAVGKYLGVKEVMTSPTFVIEKRYTLDDKTGFNKFIHIDAYRLESEKEILGLDFIKDLNDRGNLILIEWPERIIKALPHDLLKIKFKFISESEREMDVL